MPDTAEASVYAASPSSAEYEVTAFERDEPDRPREACGVFGVFAPGEDVARITYFGLYALQHRGQ